MYALYKSGSMALAAAAFLLVATIVALDYQKTFLTTRSSLIDHNDNNTLGRTSRLATAIRSVVPDSSASRSHRSDSSATKPNSPNTEARSKRLAKAGTDESLKVAQKEAWQLSDGNGPTTQQSPPGRERKDEHQHIRRSRAAGIALYLWILAGAAHQPPP